MLDSITCDTDISELLKEEDINSYVDTIKDAVKKYMNKINDFFDEELSKSGDLGISAFNIDDNSPIIDSAISFLNRIDIKNVFNNFESTVTELLEEQRRKEINKLIKELNDKIEELDSEIASRKSSLNLLDFFLYNKKFNSLTSEINDLEAEKKKYESKLDEVEGLI